MSRADEIFIQNMKDIMENGFNDKEYKNQYDAGENKTKSVWRAIGIGCIAVFVAILTVVVINL